MATHGMDNSLATYLHSNKHILGKVPLRGDGKDDDQTAQHNTGQNPLQETSSNCIFGQHLNARWSMPLRLSLHTHSAHASSDDGKSTTNEIVSSAPSIHESIAHHIDRSSPCSSRFKCPALPCAALLSNIQHRSNLALTHIRHSPAARKIQVPTCPMPPINANQSSINQSTKTPPLLISIHRSWFSSSHIRSGSNVTPTW